MLVVIPLIFVADAKLVYGNNFVAPLTGELGCYLGTQAHSWQAQSIYT